MSKIYLLEDLSVLILRSNRFPILDSNIQKAEATFTTKNKGIAQVITRSPIYIFHNFQGIRQMHKGNMEISKIFSIRSGIDWLCKFPN